MSNIKGKPFTDVLGEIENGKFLRDVTEATYNVVGAVMETRKPGKITLTIDVKPTGKGTVAIDANCLTKEPEHDRPATTFFVGQDLSLQRQDPNQPRLPLREVETADDKPLRVAE